MTANKPHIQELADETLVFDAENDQAKCLNYTAYWCGNTPMALIPFPGFRET